MLCKERFFSLFLKLLKYDYPEKLLKHKRDNSEEIEYAKL